MELERIGRPPRHQIVIVARKDERVLELADRLLPLLAAGRRIAVATSIDVIGSSPQRAGTSMAVTDAGAVLGSVSGGCVEDAALRACTDLLGGGSAIVRRFGFGDAAAARAGLACGGELDVLVHLVGGEAVAELEAAAAGEAAVLGVVTGGPVGALGRIVTPSSVASLAAAIPGLPLSLLSASLEAGRDSGVGGPAEIVCDDLVLRLFVDVAAPRRRMVVAGATETAVALAAAAFVAGHRVTVCDPRAAFLLPGRFAAGVEVVVGRAHEVIRELGLTPRDAVCVLGHDEDLDPLALAAALESDAGFVGALGSRDTTRRRRERLLALGVDPELLRRLRMPIGLDIGAASPAELAIAILAEVLAVRNGLDAGPLTSGDGPIHRAVVR